METINLGTYLTMATLHFGKIGVLRAVHIRWASPRVGVWGYLIYFISNISKIGTRLKSGYEGSIGIRRSQKKKRKSQRVEAT